MELSNKKALANCLNADAVNFQSQVSSWKKRLRCNMFSTPISEQKHIWAYIKHMRYVEYYGYMKKKNKIFLIPYLHHLSSLRKESHITGFQIKPGTCGNGLTVGQAGAGLCIAIDTPESIVQAIKTIESNYEQYSANANKIYESYDLDKALRDIVTTNID